MKLTEEEQDAIARKVHETLQQSRSVSDSEHFDHHKWISERIKAEQERREFYARLTSRLAEKGLWAVLVVLVLLMGHGVESVVKTLMQTAQGK